MFWLFSNAFLQTGLSDTSAKPFFTKDIGCTKVSRPDFRLRRKITEIGKPFCCYFEFFLREQSLPFWLPTILRVKSAVRPEGKCSKSVALGLLCERTRRPSVTVAWRTPP